MTFCTYFWPDKFPTKSNMGVVYTLFQSEYPRQNYNRKEGKRPIHRYPLDPAFEELALILLCVIAPWPVESIRQTVVVDQYFQ